MKKSENICDLAFALAKAQSEMQNPQFDSKNPHFKSSYASLASVRNAVVPVLARNGGMEMNDSDKREFSVILTSALSQYGKKSEEDALRETLRMWWKLMQRFDIETFRAAMEAHMLDPDAGRFAPMPAHIAGQIQKLSPRVKAQIGVDEAWSIAMQAEDEYSTVVWTLPIAEAWGVAKNVLPDRTGARMAFKSAYERILSGLPANAALKWYPSIGIDAARREDALKEPEKWGDRLANTPQDCFHRPRMSKTKKSPRKTLCKFALRSGKNELQ